MSNSLPANENYKPLLQRHQTDDKYLIKTIQLQQYTYTPLTKAKILSVTLKRNQWKNNVQNLETF